MPERVTSEDLRLAAEWLCEYESDDPDAPAMRRVATWLRKQASKREVEAIARGVSRQTGAPMARARIAARRVLEGEP